MTLVSLDRVWHELLGVFFVVFLKMNLDASRPSDHPSVRGKNMSKRLVDGITSCKSGNPSKCHEEVLYLQPLIPSKPFDIFSPLTGGCSEGLGAF